MKAGFPDFQPIELEDQAFVEGILRRYEPETSELTFTNLYVWRPYYDVKWCMLGECLVLTERAPDGSLYGLPPVGEGRVEAAVRLIEWLGESGSARPRIERADGALAEALAARNGFETAPQREHFDYVYRSRDLIELAGRKMHGKRNHWNRFQRRQDWEYVEIAGDVVYECYELLSTWGNYKQCKENPGIRAECEATHESLDKLELLGLRAGAIRVGGKVEAFAIGELLNSKTAVIHFEKANHKVKGLYAAIDQQFCEHEWRDVEWVNREQDLGDEGLRRAKESYQPDHMVEKFRIETDGAQ
jgi:hypothetical protein